TVTFLLPSDAMSALIWAMSHCWASIGSGAAVVAETPCLSSNEAALVACFVDGVSTPIGLSALVSGAVRVAPTDWTALPSGPFATSALNVDDAECATITPICGQDWT